ncbi:hypothetical protein J6590_017110 [Homalodisca vitripennis]|nr:hypothetical protein J6590_017110 [Homalodisca vitripennis]
MITNVTDNDSSTNITGGRFLEIEITLSNLQCPGYPALGAANSAVSHQLPSGEQKRCGVWQFDISLAILTGDQSAFQGHLTASLPKKDLMTAMCFIGSYSSALLSDWKH